MLHHRIQLEILLEKSEWTDEERQWLLNFLDNEDETALKELMQEKFSESLTANKAIDPETSARLLDSIHQKIAVSKKQRKAKQVSIWTIRIAAASVLIFLAVGSYYLTNNPSGDTVEQVALSSNTIKNDVLPGGDKAKLTLADGSTILLDDAQNGPLAQQGSAKVTKLNGKLGYKVSQTGSKEILYNTISTPRGGRYQIELPDGSGVWLNAASSIRFPTSFSGKERRVEMTGEAYFEVVKNKTRPFIVQVNDAEVQVLGTHFNVMAYADESSVNTTLLNGSVNFVNNNSSFILNPGQQAQLLNTGQVKVQQGVNVAHVVAWKNGFFQFQGADIETVIRQLSRWYDVDVVYSRKVEDLFYAEISRNIRLSDVLKALELTGKVHFKIEGKKIIVMP